MKKLLITLTILIAIMASGQAEDKLKIGEMKGGKLVVTNPEALKAFFMNSLEKSGTLGKEFKVSNAPDGKRLFLYYPVSGNKNNVTNIGVLLVINDSGAFIIKGETDSAPGGSGIGASYEIQCVGDECSQCIPVIRWISGEWLPYVACECHIGGGTCNMVSKLIVGI
jgi:hypothetical protein